MSKLGKYLLGSVCVLMFVVPTAFAGDTHDGYGTVTVEASKPSKGGGDAGSFDGDLAARTPGETPGGISVDDPSPSGEDPCEDEREAYERAQTQFEQLEDAYKNRNGRHTKIRFSAGGDVVVAIELITVDLETDRERVSWSAGPYSTEVVAMKAAQNEIMRLMAEAKKALAALAGCEFHEALASSVVTSVPKSK